LSLAEPIHHERTYYQDFEEAYENIAEVIEKIYNHKRLHSSLGYLPR
jgi:transposase InsO family protein